MRLIIACLLLVLYFLFQVSNLWAQANPVPDSSFETWAAGAPIGWSADTAQVFHSRDAHSGLWATGGTVMAGANGAPFLETSFPTLFPIGYRPGSLDGYYKFTGAGYDELLFFVVITSGAAPVAVGSFVDSSRISEYRHFSIPLLYSVDNPPDSAKVLVELQNSKGPLHTGSSFVVDDISLTAMIWDRFVSVRSAPVILQSLTSYPNPFSQQATITFTSEAADYADVRVVNLLGVEVARLFSGALTAGEHSFAWDASNVAPGMYECVMRMNGQTRTIPLALTR